jgi:hypothetical protein
MIFRVSALFRYITGLIIQQLVNRCLYLYEINVNPDSERIESFYNKLSVNNVLLIIAFIFHPIPL